MGLEDYRVILRPHAKKPLFPENNVTMTVNNSSGASPGRITVAETEALLEAMGFNSIAASPSFGGARHSHPPRHESRYSSRQIADATEDEISPAEYVVEALLRWQEEPDGDETVTSLCLRFAVCQPLLATNHFLRLIKRLCDELPLAISHEEKTYLPETFWAFRLRANEQIRRQKSFWQNLFYGDDEEVPIPVEEAWGYYLKKHRSVRRDEELFSTEQTLAPQHRAANTVRQGVQVNQSE